MDAGLGTTIEVEAFRPVVEGTEFDGEIAGDSIASKSRLPEERGPEAGALAAAAATEPLPGAMNNIQHTYSNPIEHQKS